jgi:hypothetical protein
MPETAASRYYAMRCPTLREPGDPILIEGESGVLFTIKMTGPEGIEIEMPPQLDKVECLRCQQTHTAMAISEQEYIEMAGQDDLDEDEGWD